MNISGKVFGEFTRGLLLQSHRIAFAVLKAASHQCRPQTYPFAFLSNRCFPFTDWEKRLYKNEFDLHDGVRVSAQDFLKSSKERGRVVGRRCDWTN